MLPQWLEPIAPSPVMQFVRLFLLLVLSLLVSSHAATDFNEVFHVDPYQLEPEQSIEVNSNGTTGLEQDYARLNDSKLDTSAKVEAKIVRGQNAMGNSWPYAVRLIIRTVDRSDQTRPDMMSICGGSLLSNREVLTAAHCFAEPSVIVTGILAMVGGHQISGGFAINVSTKVITHPRYNPETFDNDIAILHLKRPVPDKLAYFVRLPRSSKLPEMIWHECVTFGWGQQDPKKPETAEYLQVATLPLIADRICERAYKKADFNPSVMLCAGFLDGTRDACRGDSGGPYLCPTPTGTWYQIGIVSFGIGCAAKGIPGYYTRITSFLDWIHANRLRNTNNTI